jgi:hypothetical protein
MTANSYRLNNQAINNFIFQDENQNFQSKSIHSRAEVNENIKVQQIKKPARRALGDLSGNNLIDDRKLKNDYSDKLSSSGRNLANECFGSVKDSSDLVINKEHVNSKKSQFRFDSVSQNSVHKNNCA